MLPVWIMILSMHAAWATEIARPFWKAKEKVYQRITNGEVIVVVKSVPVATASSATTPNATAPNATAPNATEKYHLVIQGGGHVAAPASFVFKQALGFDNLVKVSGYIKSAKYDPQSEILDMTVGAFGHTGRMKLRVKPMENEVPQRMDYVVIGGALQGLSGTFSFTELAAQKTEVGITGDFRYDEFPVPKMFLEFGLEVAFQRMAVRLRQHVENEMRKKKEGRE